MPAPAAPNMADRTSDSDATVLAADVAADVAAPPASDAPASSTSADAQGDVVDNKTVFKPGRNFYLALLALMLLTLAASIDATSLSVALPVVSHALGGSALEAFWSGTSFLLASTILQPTVSAMSNVFGRKYMVYVTSFFFGAGSLIGALAGNFTVLIAGRTVQGIGGGGILALTEIIICDMVPLAIRPVYLSFLSLMWSIGTVTGPLIGAAFAQSVSWRWILYINLPLIGVGLGAVIIFLNQNKVPGGVVKKLARFDWIGSIIFTASTTSFLFGLTTGGVMHPWGTVNVLLPLIIGPFGILLFAFYEVKVATEPMIHRGIFNNYTMVISYVQTLIHGMVLWSSLYFLPLYYEGVLGYSPIITAVAVLPMTLTVAPSAAAVGIISGKTGHYRWGVWVGWLLSTFGSGLFLLLKPDTSIPAWIFLVIPFSIGTGMLFPAHNLAIQAACDPALNGQASAFFSFIRTFGQAVGLAVSGVVFQNGMQKKLMAVPGISRDLAVEYSKDATSMVAVLNAMPAGAQKTLMTKAYNNALYNVFYAQLAFSAFAFAIGFFIRGFTLEQEHVTQQGLVDATRDNGNASAEEKIQPES